MLTAEIPSVDGQLVAATPRRKGMDCKPTNHANKKLVQARLPFKRLNPEPKDGQEPKRSRVPPRAEPGVSDGENETEPSLLPVCNGPALVNGRGPLDGFLTSKRPVRSVKCIHVDLTQDDSLSPVKQSPTPGSASPSPPIKDTLQSKDKRASAGKSSNGDHIHKTGDSDSNNHITESDMEEMESEVAASVSQLDTTQGSDSEEEEQEESTKADVSSLGNTSMLSVSSVSSLSEAESSPEQANTESSGTPTETKTTPKMPADEKIKRRSLKSLQEQEERLRMRQEKERQKEEAKAVKEKKREEARKLKEEREREKREKKEKDEREKREKKEKEEKEKAVRLKAKEEQRKSKQEAKLEEKRRKEEEKRSKDEEKRLKEEKDRQKAEKSGITRFLQKPRMQQAPKTLSAACGKFAPFEIKENMCLAPLTRVQCEESVLEELDQYLIKPCEILNGLKDWIHKKPRRSGPTKLGPTRRTSLLGDSILVVEGPKADAVLDRKRYGSMKLLQFHENYRPAYWGTWSKKSSHVSPRCPLRRDKDLLDYEVDSDEEWEEEEPGESLSHSEGEDEEEGGDNEDEDDDGFFVPHGYLSDGEGALEEEEGGDLEKQTLRQKLKAREWDELMSSKKKMKVLEAVVKGCVWEVEGTTPELFRPYAVCLVTPLPKADTSPSPESLALKRQGDEQLLGQLLPLLHGNVNSSKVIITELQEFCRQQMFSLSSSPASLTSPVSSADNIPTRIRLKRIIKSNAVYEKRSTYRRCCWYAHADVLSQFGQEALPVPCQWTYLTSGAREEPREDPQAATGSHGNSPTTPQASSTNTPASSNKRKSTGSMSITRFMKKCADPEQSEAMETDGFQADTEDDDEDDCVIINAQSGPCEKGTTTAET